MNTKSILRISFFVLLFTFHSDLAFNVQSVEKSGRRATLIDQAADKSELFVTGIKSFYKSEYVRSVPRNSFYIFTTTLEYCIPIDSVISIKRIKNKMNPEGKYGKAIPIYEVKYILGNQKINIEGSLASSQADTSKNILHAKIGSLNTEIDMNDISSLFFADEPRAIEEFTTINDDKKFSVTFVDNSKVTANNMHFHQEDYSTDGYLIGGEYIQNFYPFLPISKGSLKMEVPFQDIQSLKLLPIKNEISPDWYYEFECELILADNSILKGKLEKIYEFSGFTGITEKGPFFVEVRKVNSIVSLP